MRKMMWFGNAEKMTWVPCPAVDMSASKNHWSSRSDYLNGGIGFRRSTTGAMVYEMNWNLTSEVELDKIEGFYEGVWGEGPFYFLDPQAMNTNVFPAAWAQPRVALIDGPPLVFDQKPTKVVTSSPLRGAPNVGVQYTLTSDSVPEELTIPIPEGHKFIFSVFQDQSASAYVAFSQDGAAPVKAYIHTLQAATNGSLVKFSITGTGHARVYAMMGQILPVGVYTPSRIPAPNYAWTGTPHASASTETVGGVVTRTNLLFTPEPGVAGWYSTSSDAWPGVLAPGEGREGRNAVKTTRAASSPSQNVGQAHYIGASGGGVATLPLVQEGLVYNFSVYTKTDLPSWQNSLALFWYDAGGGIVLSQIQTPVTAAIDSDGWSRASWTAPAPAGAVRVNFRSYVYTNDGQNAPEGAQVWFADAMLEEGTEATPWFYGDTEDIPAIEPTFFQEFISGKGNSGVEFESFERHVYSSALDLVGATATFVEVGSWR